MCKIGLQVEGSRAAIWIALNGRCWEHRESDNRPWQHVKRNHNICWSSSRGSNRRLRLLSSGWLAGDWGLGPLNRGAPHWTLGALSNHPWCSSSPPRLISAVRSWRGGTSGYSTLSRLNLGVLCNLSYWLGSSKGDSLPRRAALCRWRVGSSGLCHCKMRKWGKFFKSCKSFVKWRKIE